MSASDSEADFMEWRKIRNSIHEFLNTHHLAEQCVTCSSLMMVMGEPFTKGEVMMFDRSWIGYPCPSLVECLVVFVILFLAGSLWSACIRWYIEYRTGEATHA